MNLTNIGTEIYRHPYPCLFDTVKHTGDTGTPDFEVLDTITGGTVAWNQLVSTGQRTTTITPDGTYTFSTSSASGGRIKANHVLFVAMTVKNYNGGKTLRGYCQIGGKYGSPAQDITGTSKSFAWICKPSSDGNSATFGLSNITTSDKLTSQDEWTRDDTQIFDLTLMFGSTIADYLYTLESGTDGAGIAKLKSWGFFTKGYYAYNAGELMSVNASAHKTYGADTTLLGNYALDSSLTLRGIPKLDANNNLYYDGDSYESSGTVTRKYGSVDLGGETVAWIKDTTSLSVTVFKASITGRKGGASTFVCSKYVTVRTNRNALATNDKSIASWNNTDSVIVGIYDSSCVNMTATEFKTAMSGVYLVYELANPTTETATGFTNPQSIDPDGTEQFADYAYTQGTRDVEIPVGRLSVYYAFSHPRIGDMLIDGESLQANGWFLKWRKLSAPSPKSDYTSIYGRDGSIDQTEALGDVFYEDRSLYLDMVYNGEDWNGDYSELLNDMHGQKRILQFTDDPNWYWSARLVATEFSHKEHSLTMSGVAFPYKMSFIQREYSATVSGATEQTATVLTLAGSRMRVSPKIVSTGTVTIKWGTNTAALSAGTHYVRGLKVGAEGVTLKVYGTGSVNITYREGSL